jgi:hypothetical protein
VNASAARVFYDLGLLFCAYKNFLRRKQASKPEIVSSRDMIFATYFFIHFFFNLSISISISIGTILRKTLG